jgi:Glycosyltransferases, probably involved in cell wall biogenesis
MLDDIIAIFSILVSGWSVYNSLLAMYGFTWSPTKHTNYSGKTFSIIIPAKNEEKVLPRLLDRLINQEYDKSKYEIIVVEDGSTDKTYEVCKQYEETYSRDFIKCLKLDQPKYLTGK